MRSFITSYFWATEEKTPATRCAFSFFVDGLEAEMGLLWSFRPLASVSATASAATAATAGLWAAASVESMSRLAPALFKAVEVVCPAAIHG